MSPSKKNSPAWIGFLIALSAVVPATAEPVAHVDNFEAAELDTNFWSLRRINEKRHWIDMTTAFEGKGSLAIRVSGRDLDKECKCQQNEVRESSAHRLKFGDEAWYAFSFRIKGLGPRVGDQRWVIGGWKQESNGSAFLAQRFDRNVFHITLESGDTRILLASAVGDTPRFIELMRRGIMEQFKFLAEPTRYSGTTDVKLEYGPETALPDPTKDWVHMLYRIKGGLKGDGVVEVYANGKFIVRATGTIGVKEFDGPSQYFKFGHNRAPMPSSATIYLDKFKRAASRSEIE